MMPETLEAGLAAIETANAGNDLPRIRCWLAAETKTMSLLPPSVGEKDPYNQASIHDLVGNRPEAIACWLRCLGESYSHRAVLV